jgi:hypothetical protein
MNRILQIALIDALLVVVACSGSSATTDVALSEDPRTPCSNFVEAYAQCQSRALRGHPEVAAERAATTRSSITAHMAAAKTDTDRAKLAATCTDGIKALRSVCP